MVKKTILRVFLIFFFIILLFSIYIKFYYKKDIKEFSDFTTNNEETYNSNILENVEYVSKDAKGNEYIIRAIKGEIDIENSNIIFLTKVNAFIKLNNSNIIDITSEYGKYNTLNYDTIFSKKVIIDYLDNKITGDYLDFSINRNNMIISRNVVYTNLENILKADVIEVNIETKDIKVFMYNASKKINIKNKD
jgi:hypothetical protein